MLKCLPHLVHVHAPICVYITVKLRIAREYALAVIEPRIRPGAAGIIIRHISCGIFKKVLNDSAADVPADPASVIICMVCFLVVVFVCVNLYGRTPLKFLKFFVTIPPPSHDGKGRGGQNLPNWQEFTLTAV